jgi:hypothetical protein
MPSFSAGQLRRRRGNPPAATARTVWLGEQIRDLVPRGQPLEHVSPNGAVAATAMRVT